MLLRKTDHPCAWNASCNDRAQSFPRNNGKIHGIVHRYRSGNLTLGAVTTAAVLRVEDFGIENVVRCLPLVSFRGLSRHPAASRKEGSEDHRERTAKRELAHASVKPRQARHTFSSVLCCASTPSLSAIDQLCCVSTLADLKTTYPQTIPKAT